MDQGNPILIYQKKADKTLNRIVIPKVVIDKFGYLYSMEVYEDKLILRPVRKDK